MVEDYRTSPRQSAFRVPHDPAPARSQPPYLERSALLFLVLRWHTTDRSKTTVKREEVARGGPGRPIKLLVRARSPAQLHVRILPRRVCHSSVILARSIVAATWHGVGISYRQDRAEVAAGLARSNNLEA
jgi:hypothetical protein